MPRNNMALEIEPVPQIIQYKETAGKEENSKLTYHHILLTGITLVKKNSEKKKRGMKLLEMINKMEPDEELALNIEKAMEENRKVKINAPDL